MFLVELYMANVKVEEEFRMLSTSICVLISLYDIFTVFVTFLRCEKRVGLCETADSISVTSPPPAPISAGGLQMYLPEFHLGEIASHPLIQWTV